MKDDRQNEVKNCNLLRFVHAQDSGGIYEGTLVAMLLKSGPAYCCSPPSVTPLFSSKSRANISGDSE